MPDEKTKQAMLEALEAGDYEKLIELAETQPTPGAADGDNVARMIGAMPLSQTRSKSVTVAAQAANARRWAALAQKVGYMSVCFSCKKKIDAVALTNLVYSFEPINDELVQVGWHKECYLAAQQSVQRMGLWARLKCWWLAQIAHR